MSYVEVDIPIKKYEVLYDPPPGTSLIICMGGRGGGKTYMVSVFAAFSATVRNKRIAVLRDEKESIQESILNEIFQRYDAANEHGHFNGNFDKINTGIRNRKTGAMQVFTKGFKASSNEKQANLKGVSDVDIAIVEEAEDIRSVKKFNKFRDSMRKPGRLIIIMLNTPDIEHWIIKQYFDLEPVLDKNGEATGYFKPVPKPIPGFLAIITDHTDNQFLPDDVRRDYESYNDPNSTRYDPHYYLTEIKGYASSGRRGQILTRVKPLSMSEYLQLPYKEIYGLDFGTSKPAGLIGCKIHHDVCWARELSYLPKDTLGIGIMLCDLEFTNEDIIIADSAVPIDIGRLRRGWTTKELTPEQTQKYPQLLRGFTVYGAIKGPNSIKSGLRAMRGMRLFAVASSENLWDEIRKYIWAVDRNGNTTDEPVDDFNHLIDPWRYVITARGRLYT